MAEEKKTEVSRVLAWGMDLPEFNGKVYRLGEPTQAIKAEFELFLKHRAMQSVIAVSHGLPEAEQEKLRRILLKEFTLGKYRWGGPYWQEAMTEQETIEHLIWLLLQEGESRKERGSHLVERDTVTAMIADETVGVWLMAAVFLVTGSDPTLALTMAKLSFVRAGENVKAAKETMEKLIASVSTAT